MLPAADHAGARPQSVALPGGCDAACPFSRAGLCRAACAVHAAAQLAPPASALDLAWPRLVRAAVASPGPVGPATVALADSALGPAQRAALAAAARDFRARGMLCEVHHGVLAHLAHAEPPPPPDPADPLPEVEENFGALADVADAEWLEELMRTCRAVFGEGAPASPHTP